MAQEDEFEHLVDLTAEWVSLEDLIAVEPYTTYYIQSRGPDIVILQQSIGEPTEESTLGTLLIPYKRAEYKKGTTTLYLKAFYKECTVNITKAEE